MHVQSLSLVTQGAPAMTHDTDSDVGPVFASDSQPMD